ncbi:hypothetical protein RJZ90_007647 [Blastomyces dermatitidis]
MSTLLEYLSVADPSLDRTNVKTGSNSFNRDWEDLEGIEEWTDFIYDNLIAMLGDVLARPYQQHEFDPPAPVQRSACCIINEPTVTAVLLKWNHTIVDCALELASKASATMPAISWTLGNHTGLCGETVLPDWAGIYSNMPFPPSNRVPGDTKVSGKWNTDQQHDPLHSKRDEFHKPLRQVVHYAKLFNTRYAYVISDKELVCIRRTVSEYEGVPLAAGRTARISQPSATPSRRLDRLPQDPTTPSPRTDSSPPFRVVIPHAQSQRRDEQYLTPERRTRVRQDISDESSQTLSVYETAIYECGQLSSAAVKLPISHIIQLINKKENKLEEMDITGRTPLSWAAEWGRLDVVELLLDRGAELDRMDWNGRSALSWVAEGGSLTVIQLLIKRGADVNLRDVEGTGSLGWAHWTGRGENYKLV